MAVLRGKKSSGLKPSPILFASGHITTEGVSDRGHLGQSLVQIPLKITALKKQSETPCKGLERKEGKER